MARTHESPSIKDHLERVWDLLTQSSPSFQEPDRRRQSRLLSTSVLILFAVLSLGVVLIRLVSPARLYSGDRDLILGAAVLVLLLIAYLYNRRGRYTLAAVVAFIAPEIGILGATMLVWLGESPYYDAGDVNLLVYTVVPVLFASMLLSIRALTGLVLFNTVTMLALSMPFDHIAISDVILGPLLFSFAVSALVLLVTAQRDQLEQDRQVQLTEQKERYQSLFDRVPVGLYRTTPEGNILNANRALVRLLEYPDRRTLLAESITDLFVNQDVREQELTILDQDGILRNFDMELRRWDGEIIWVQDTCRTVRDDQGKLLYYEGALEDITRRRRMEEALRESEERFRNIFQNAPIGIYRTTPDGRILMANATLVEMLGYDSFVGLAQRNLEKKGFHSDHPRSTFRRRIEDEGRITGLESAWEREDGTTVFVRENARVVRDADGDILFYEGTVEDITERKDMEERLRRQDRLAAVGQMAGGIAHDFRNFLTSIILYAQIPLRKPDVPPDVEKSLETVVGEAQQAANLVQQILDFSRRSVMKTELLDLGELTREVTAILQKTIPENINVALEGPLNCCIVNADPTRIQQVLMNLALNARDAMPEGGNLGITLTRLRVETGEEPLPEMAAGDWACLSVSDTGTGMDESVEEHLFEPFFTTKEPGKGTGLGLAQVYGIVKQHDGYIAVETAVGVGTTFRIYLPIHRAMERTAAERRSNLVPGRGETILLVEDEEKVREATARVLESLGYRALTAVNGREAERLAENVDFDLLITDLVMPQMGGKTLVRTLKRREGELKALGLTGYVVDEAGQEHVPSDFLGVIHKPFEVEDLAQAIREALES